MEKIYRIKDVAEMLKINRKKVSALIHSGYLKAINMNTGGKTPTYRIFGSDLATYLKEHKYPKDKE